MGPSNDFVNFNRSIKDQIAALSAQITKSFFVFIKLFIQISDDVDDKFLMFKTIF